MSNEELNFRLNRDETGAYQGGIIVGTAQTGGQVISGANAKEGLEELKATIKELDAAEKESAADK